MSKKGSFIIALICCANSLFAQNISVEKEQNSEKKDSLIMNAFEWYQEAFPDQNIDQTQFLELLDNFIQKPISINDKHIKDCILLNEIQVISILKYRE